MLIGLVIGQIKIYQFNQILYNLEAQNEEYFTKDYFKLHKNLTQNDKNENIKLQFSRFGK